MLLNKCIVALACASACSVCFAHEHTFMPHATHQALSWHNADHLALPEVGCKAHPKQWRYMDGKERAEIWPFLSPRMQHHYWSSMTTQEKIAMQRDLSPEALYQLRHRFIVACLDHEKEGHASHDEDGQLSGKILTAQERAVLRSQIRQMNYQDSQD